MKRIFKFIFIVTFGLIGPFYLYLGFRLAHSWFEWLFLALPFLAVLSLPVVHITRADRSSRFSEVWSHVIFFSMGLLTYLAVFTIARDLAWLLLHFGGVATGLQTDFVAADELVPARFVLAFAALAIALGTFRAARGPIVKWVKIESDALPVDLEGFRILQISDLHIGQTIRRRYVEAVVRASNEISPDLIALTGDIGDGSVQTYASELEAFSKLKAKHGIFYVTGNHEYYWNAGEWMGAINSFGAEVLTNRGVHVNVGGTSVFIAGISDPQAPGGPKYPGPDLDAAISGGWNAAFRILLSHRPGFAKRASELGFDLQLSGHTHGGQFFPWTVVVKLVHEFSAGLYRVGKMAIYVSSGTGSWGPLLRLGTSPELTVLELVSSRKPQA